MCISKIEEGHVFNGKKEICKENSSLESNSRFCYRFAHRLHCLPLRCREIKHCRTHGFNAVRILFDRECTGSEIVKAAEERDYDIIVLTGEQAEEAGEAIAPFVTENCLVVFENMTLEQVQKATGLVEGFSDEKSSSNASIGLMMKGGALRLCGFESKNGIIDRLTNENVADAAADMLSNNN